MKTTANNNTKTLRSEFYMSNTLRPLKVVRENSWRILFIFLSSIYIGV